MKSPNIKRSVVLAQKKSSITLEQPFWDGLTEIASRMALTRNALMTEIDRERDHVNLSSAVRLFVLEYHRSGRAPDKIN
jgi:predicted DNA-binding ribbon-helix-helix protein